MSLINDALKRANQFPQPSLILRETSAFRPVELAQPPSLPLTLLVLVLALLAPLSWVIYRTSQGGPSSAGRSPSATAQARDLPGQAVPASPSSAWGASAAASSAPSWEPAQTAQASARPSSVLTSAQRVVVLAKEAPPTSPSPRTHTIKPGETPTSIARQYGIKLQMLLEANPSVSARRLKIGQALNIPSC